VKEVEVALMRPLTQAKRAAKRSKLMTPVTPELGRRERNKQAKRERIIDAAWQLFAEKGIDGTTTAEVAERAGIAKGTLFLYASDKDDLVLMLMHERLERTSNEAVAKAQRKSGLLEQWLFVFGELYALYGACGPVGQRFIHALPSARGLNAASVAALTTAFSLRLGAMVAEAQARDEVAPDVDPMQAAMAAFGLYFFGLSMWLQGLGDPMAVRDGYLAPALGLLMRGVGGGRGSSPS
jgi:AcrR family transcriptional regulator